MKRVGMFFYALCYIAVFVFVFFLEYTISSKKSYTDGRIQGTINCGENMKDNGETDLLYQATYLYLIDEKEYEIIGECKKDVINEVDIVYEKDNPHKAVIYERSIKVYVLMLLAFFFFTVPRAFMGTFNKVPSSKQKHVFMGLSLIFTALVSVSAFGRRIDYMSCFLNMDALVLLPLILIIIGIVEIFVPDGLGAIKKLVPNEESE